MEFKQNKYLTAEKQIITANPDVTTVRILPAVFPIHISITYVNITLYLLLWQRAYKLWILFFSIKFVGMKWFLSSIFG